VLPFKAPIEDILVSYRFAAGVDDLPDWDGDTAKEVLDHFSHLAESEIAPLDEIGDRQGARLDRGRVRMPDGFRKAYRQLAEGGWLGLTIPERFGGMGAHPLLAAGVSEIFSGANHAFQMVCGLVPGAVTTLLRFGTPEQQAAWIPRLARGELLSTMCLSEPGAGSDLARIRTRAEQDGDLWRITGEKVFISGGDQDLSDGILHLVLARSGKFEDGIKGLSLFLCPSETTSGRNAITVPRIEEKLGLHASPTCQMQFDGAKAMLVGEEGGGLRAMFTLMNHARIDVALQGVAHASRAARIAEAYAADRIQGRKADGTPAKLDDHADIIRMLNTQRALALGGRAMCHIALAEQVRGASQTLMDVLTSVCKVFCSEAGTTSADLGIQVLGGYGYLREYRIEQTWRDARITAIYEGTNGIHARSLATRGLRTPESRADFSDLIKRLIGGDVVIADLLADWQNFSRKVVESNAPEAKAHELMQATSELYFRAVWRRMVSAAKGSEITSDYAALYRHVETRPWLLGLGADADRA
jgi:alkylation response protein AidB-like acyl-CoA dehydrogenase